MADFVGPELPAEAQEAMDLFVCNLPIGPGVVASIFLEKWDRAAVWICFIEPATDVPVHTTVPLSELDQFLLTLMGRYAPKTILM
ncbi:hypothetical protein CH72_641 [Burkholderia ambifaria AMMD]|jgi:hypothetical protein|uniref:hypothetical protein n=1 Tax=Burkholderia ambifaria TaxID=152480 RepID=UPI00059F1E71|nr:hypothetical protein [Burkholderia ambifaria]AJY22743.1 hypothetical protein CH72_641 [Burkholderia ambifaria AMMD]MBR7929918.1 hypothetical protein [Burkholderia ambifaria]PEH66246.1 hypothetical protein CRM91_28700 [Burkholderia ambifaria]QQC03207.1 hypothetical protein I6H84_10475 [Burkholderia ambifaria]UZU06033.1 hypothetical protein OR987_21740 [Burkholderia ambifaria]